MHFAGALILNGGTMRSFHSGLLLTLGLIVSGLAACQSDLPTSAEHDRRPGASARPFGPLLETESNGEPLTLIRVRGGQKLTTDDARLTVAKGSLSFPAVIDEKVDGERFVSFRFGPDGLRFLPRAILAISVDKADLRGIDPSTLRVAVASNDRDDWQVVGGIYDPITRTVLAPILHFSRYALCVE